MGCVTGKGELRGGRLVGWVRALACYRYAAREKRVSLIAMSDQDAVLDLPPFEKVGRKLSFAYGVIEGKREGCCENSPEGLLFLALGS